MAAADSGSLLMAAQLVEAMLGDGVISGTVDSMAAGIIRLPLSIEGAEALVKRLVGDPSLGNDGDFWRMHPSAVLGRSIVWGMLLGAGIGEYVEDQNTGLPVLHNVEAQHVAWRRNVETRAQELYIVAEDGEHIIRPGDGRWFVFAPWGINRFWLHGKWRPCGKNWLDKVQAQDQRTVAGARHALGITWLQTPENRSRDEDAQAIVAHITSSPTPPVIALEEGWSIEHTSISTEGYQQWTAAKKEADEDNAIALRGQSVTTTGTSGGWSKGDIHENVEASLIEKYAGALSEAVQRDGLDPFAEREGFPGIRVEWDPTPPKDKKAIGEALGACGDGITKADASLKSRGKRVRAEAIFESAGYELEDLDPQEKPSTIVDGLPVIFEYPPGSIRSGTDERGVPWAVQMGSVGYGYIPGTQGRDGEPLDVYVGPARGAKTLFVLKQVRPDQSVDELKLFVGFSAIEDAQEAWDRLVGRPELVGGWQAANLDTLIDLMRAIPARSSTPAEDVGKESPSNALPPAPHPGESQEMSAKAGAVATQDEDVVPGDEPTNTEAVRLAEEMTLHGLNRCEHECRNRCPRCGIERVRGVLTDENGKFVGWKIAWKAIGTPAAAPTIVATNTTPIQTEQSNG